MPRTDRLAALCSHLCRGFVVPARPACACVQALVQALQIVPAQRKCLIALDFSACAGSAGALRARDMRPQGAAVGGRGHRPAGMRLTHARDLNPPAHIRKINEDNNLEGAGACTELLHSLHAPHGHRLVYASPVPAHQGYGFGSPVHRADLSRTERFAAFSSLAPFRRLSGGAARLAGSCSHGARSSNPAGLPPSFGSADGSSSTAPSARSTMASIAHTGAPAPALPQTTPIIRRHLAPNVVCVHAEDKPPVQQQGRRGRHPRKVFSLWKHERLRPGDMAEIWAPDPKLPLHVNHGRLVQLVERGGPITGDGWYWRRWDCVAVGGYVEAIDPHTGQSKSRNSRFALLVPDSALRRASNLLKPVGWSWK
jgi:hypothetical protein